MTGVKRRAAKVAMASCIVDYSTIKTCQVKGFDLMYVTVRYIGNEKHHCAYFVLQDYKEKYSFCSKR